MKKDLIANNWNAMTADEWAGLPATSSTNNPPSATWDAWKRLVKLVDTSTSNPVAEYQIVDVGQALPDGE